MPDPRKPEQNPQHRPEDPQKMPGGDSPDMTEEQRRRRGQQKPGEMGGQEDNPEGEDENLPGQPGRPERENIDKPSRQ